MTARPIATVHGAIDVMVNSGDGVELESAGDVGIPDHVSPYPGLERGPDDLGADAGPDLVPAGMACVPSGLRQLDLR